MLRIGSSVKIWYILFITAVRLRSHQDHTVPRSLNASRPMNEHDVNANLQILSASFVNHKFLPEYKDSFPPHTSSNGQLLKPIDCDANVPRVSCVSPMLSKMHRYIL